MPNVRVFKTAANVTVEVVASDDHSVKVTVSDGPSKRIYDSLDMFLRLEMRTFQAVYPQMTAAQDQEWVTNMRPALTTVGHAYAPPVLLGNLGEADPLAGGGEVLEVVRSVTTQAFRGWQLTHGTLDALTASVEQIKAARTALLSTVQSAATDSARALGSGTHKRRQALGRLEGNADEARRQLDDLTRKQAALKEQLRQLTKEAARAGWEVAGKQTHNVASAKTFSVKIKKGKFRELVFFSQHRHSVPYFLEAHADTSPDSKPLNTLTILTEGELIRSFDHFVGTVYVPYLNEARADNPLKFRETYNPPAGSPMFIADHYYGDQGMHCTPVATPGVAYTLTQTEHAFFITLLDYVRSPTDKISAGDLGKLRTGFDAAQLATPFGELAKAYPKLMEIFGYLPKRTRSDADEKLLAGSIKGCRERLGMGR